MKRKVITTEDGSTSIQMEDWGETYHSIYGAVQEAKHVYIKHGLQKVIDKEQVAILEMGFGTGLNAYLTYLEAKGKAKVAYHTIEAFPVSDTELEALNYFSLAEQAEDKVVYRKLHEVSWDIEQIITPDFTLFKMLNKFELQELESNRYDLIYFDAFGYPYQPDLWSEEIFAKMYACLKIGGVLTTYACRGVINRTMKKVGFEIEKVPGPPGKREMVIAYKR
ncbi:MULTISPECIES: tRNA (5-methylaminomethyl-2-thiouridine)(34)-methyltransferase MnmD [Myroides]|uniref:tRNA (5-methylaminomethyl-2-thiouridine)(34)-methyltransferase MnmD n=1 Tax=Myroides albus TaxID=2562892 RepID=A0A6I3LRJ1_9FLAO|nr:MULTISPECIES: tRNA (5-methylaminomethyl-2-thiouridine)(34)-methyltransferase MnmD [Myroides]MTG98595.1 tRNA (5-methylaminomethyl-2-thiouridine)(34)-methyltransferase MnmD [Myroides albus]MVX36627.1 tRNA (5-methylaminomethyl-2-thiouridine)(34)-methyltransferase MnmD [Myroides sp. LoEW2-1]UVD79965.1 tRNA (5-methylaminomethyl-2-thiouridine)(34)-methyltransferase MnmD [Myroides albus]